MKNYETPKAVVTTFSGQDVILASSVNAFDDVGPWAWGDLFDENEGDGQ